MKTFPSRSDVFAAECRLAHSTLVAREHLLQVRSAIRARLTQPSTLFMAASLGYMFGARLARRNKPRSRQDAASARKPFMGLVYTLLIRFGLQRLAQAWASHRLADAPTATVAAKP